MKKIFFSLLFFLSGIQAYTLANCPVNNAPTNINSSSVCNKGFSIFSASLNDPNNSLVWLDTANRIIGVGNNFQKYIANPGTNFKVAEAGYDLVSAKVGPIPTNFNSTYPSQNFSNGQYFTCLTNIRIDSILLKTNNPLNGNIQIWTNSPENGGYILQKIPFSINKNGDANTRIAINAILKTGNYFINTEITSGNGILYRANSGAVYPYTASNLLSITGSNFAGANNRYYYFFDWNISKMCIGPESASFSPSIINTKDESLPYKETFNLNLPCDWTLSSNNSILNWQHGNSSIFTSPNFVIPADSGILISSALSQKLERKSLVQSPWFVLKKYSKEQDIKLKFNYEYLNSQSSKAYLYIIDSKNNIYLKDSLNKQLNTFSLKSIDLRSVLFLDSLRIVFEHKESSDSTSVFAIKDFEIESSCEITYVLDLTTDKFGSEISWEIRDKNSRELIAISPNYMDIDPYNAIAANSINSICLKRGKDYIFKIMDSFGDGLDDGVIQGKYLFRSACGDTVLFGQGAFEYGGQMLPELAWDSIIFKAIEYKVNLGPDLTVNIDDSVILDAGEIGPYNWTTGDTTRYLTIKNTNKIPGKYGYAVTVRGNDLNCRSKDTIEVTFIDIFNPILTVNLVTDTKGSEIKWELRDFDTDTLILTKGPFSDVIPYNLEQATHVENVNVAYGQKLKFKIIDLAGNGLNDGTNQGSIILQNNCSPRLFENSTIIFPFQNLTTRFDSIVFISNDKPKINIGNNTSICVGDTIVLDAGAYANSYLWSNGKTSKQITIKSSDLFLGDNVISISTEVGVCNVKDTIHIFLNSLPNSDFTTTQLGGFLSASANPGGSVYIWDFGDGTTTNGLNVTHNYQSNGVYQIKLIVLSSVGCVSSTNKTVNITGVGISDHKNVNEFELYPNPSTGIVSLKTNSDTKFQITIYNAQGAKVYEELSYTIDNKKSFDFRALSNGIYVVQIISGNQVFRRKIIIEK